MGDAIESYPVLVISNIPWDFVWQRHQSIASLWAREGKVFFCELPGIRRVRWSDAGRLWARVRALWQENPKQTDGSGLPPNLTLLRPMILPATNAFFCAINRWQLRRLIAGHAVFRNGFGVVITYSASRTALDLLAKVSWRELVYDCTDDFLEVQGLPGFFKTDEQSLLAIADITLVPSQTLHDRKSPFARRCTRLPHGAFVDRFICDGRRVPGDGRLTLLYYGHLHRQHLDFDLIELIAKARPHWRVILVGPVKTPHRFPANVELTGQQSHDRLRVFAEQAHVLILPYVMNNYTAAVMPAKTYECLATGRPVVAAPLPGLVAELSGVFRFATSEKDWVMQIEMAARDDTDEARGRRQELAMRNSWEARFVELKRLLAKEIPT